MISHVSNILLLKRSFISLFVCLLLAACGSGSGPKEPRVSVLYAVANDGTERDSATLDSALKTVQAWYKSELGGPTFVANASVVSCTLPNIADYYAINSYSKVLEDVAACEGVNLDDADIRWLIYADVIHECATPGDLGLAATGRSIFSRLELDGLAGRSATDDCGNAYERTSNYYQGQMAHELGRSLGLINPSGCLEDDPTCDDEALMFSGFAQFPDTYLTAEDKAELLKTRFIK